MHGQIGADRRPLEIFTLDAHTPHERRSHLSRRIAAHVGWLPGRLYVKLCLKSYSPLSSSSRTGVFGWSTLSSLARSPIMRLVILSLTTTSTHSQDPWCPSLSGHTPTFLVTQPGEQVIRTSASHPPPVASLLEYYDYVDELLGGPLSVVLMVDPFVIWALCFSSSAEAMSRVVDSPDLNLLR